MSRPIPKFVARLLAKMPRRALFAIATTAVLCSFAPRVLAQPRNAPRAAIFSGFPGDNNGGAGRAVLQAELRAAGYTIVPLSPAQMSSSTELSKSRFDLLVLPDARRLPSGSVEPLRKYLTSGGNVVACGLPLWSEARSLVDGRWMTRAQSEDAIARTPSENRLLDFSDGLGAWQKSHGPNDTPAQYSLETAEGQRVLHARIVDHKSWNTFTRPLRAPFRAGQNLLIFRARGTVRTKQLSVELSERDGSRWIAVIDLKPEWKSYALPIERFKAWQPTAGRGGTGDKLNLQNVTSIAVGIAMTHTAALSYGAHEWWISDFGTARNPFPGQMPPELGAAPFLQSLSPVYQVFPIHGAVTVGTPGSGARFAARGALSGLHPRPNATGFDKRRKFRWQELLNARAIGDAKALASTREGYRGAVAALVANAPTENGGALWAAFTAPVSNAAFYTQPTVRRVLRETLAKMRRGVLLQEGGSRTFTAFQDENVIVGARVASQKTSGALRVRLRVLAPGAKAAAFEKVWPVNVKAGTQATVSSSFRPKTWPRGGFRVVTQLLEGARVLDEVSHDLNVWIPKKNPQFITAQNGEFRLNGKRWKSNSVNYMPSSGIGIIDNDVFEKWISAPSYDPEIIERDLRHVRAMGFNSVSAFVYYDERRDTNTVDFLRRCENLDLKVNLSLRPGVWAHSNPPLEFHWAETRLLIESARLAQNDTVFVYDIAWEPSHYDNKYQQGYVPDWTKWVQARYGSIAKAEATWGMRMPQNLGAPTVPPMEQLTEDGPWRVLAADYRLFLDEFIHGKYNEPRRLVKTIDPNHLFSFRMQYSGDPNFIDVGLLPYDFYGLRNAIDVWEPEGYGLIGDWETVKTGRFTVDYARLNNPQLPVLYAEAGNHVWNLSSMEPNEERLESNGRLYRDIYRMLRESDADGISFWWYPGGFRVAEGSDYGLANADGTLRPQTRVLMEEGPKFLAAPKLPAPDVFIPIERDSDARGLPAMYQKVQADYWRAIEQGKRPALRWLREPSGAPRK